MRKSKLFIFFAVVGVILCAILLLIALAGPEHWFMVSQYASMSKPIQFFGQVVDQEGNPIDGATVLLAINEFDATSYLGTKDYMDTRKVALQTGADGRFAFEGKGMGLYVERVSKRNYLTIPEEKWENQTHLGHFDYMRSGDSPYYIPDPKKPAIFPLRKPDEERILWPTRGGTDAQDKRKLMTTQDDH